MAEKFTPPDTGSPSAGFRLTPRWILGLTIAAVCLIFVFSNTGQATLRFLWLELSGPGWVFLFVLLGAGFVSGWLMARSRYRS
jgi:uncharacterized integral membrane protein